MNLAEAITIGKSAGGKTLAGIFVTSDGSTYKNPNLEKLKTHAKKDSLTLYDVEAEKIIYNPRSKK